MFTDDSWEGMLQSKHRSNLIQIIFIHNLDFVYEFKATPGNMLCYL